jgi:uncharacterized protein (TIGR02271 family)
MKTVASEQKDIDKQTDIDKGVLKVMAEIRTSTRTPGSEVIAFFRDRSDAIAAISDLRDAGFTSDQIGLAMGGGRDIATEKDRSIWEKIKDFFKGESETYSGDEENYQSTFGHLALSGDRARYYASGIASGGAVVTTSAPINRMDEAREILKDNEGDLRASGFESTMPAGAPVAAGEQRIQLRGELLRAVKERVQRGEIRLRKEVVTEQQTMNVPVTREEVIVEQVPASESRPASGTIGEQGEVRIPVSEERVRVSKEQVVRGEVRAQKRQVQDTEQLSDEVKHEEVRVEKEGNVKVNDKTVPGKKKPAA